MIWLPLSIFGICCLGQVWFSHRVVSALEQRHPEIYRRIHGLFAMRRVSWFALMRRDRGLNDPELTARTKQLQWLTFVALGAWLVAAVLIFTGHA